MSSSHPSCAFPHLSPFTTGSKTHGRWKEEEQPRVEINLCCPPVPILSARGNRACTLVSAAEHEPKFMLRFLVSCPDPVKESNFRSTGAETPQLRIEKLVLAEFQCTGVGSRELKILRCGLSTPVLVNTFERDNTVVSRSSAETQTPAIIPDLLPCSCAPLTRPR